MRTRVMALAALLALCLASAGYAAIIAGTGGDDTLSGTATRDVIEAFSGDDRVAGNDGPDTIDGGPGNDTLDGGAGDDRLRTRDGEVDRIACGPGHDRAFLDAIDVIVDASAENPKGSCERVQRRPARR